MTNRSQYELFGNENSAPRSVAPDECIVESVGKRRDGGTKYWCMAHHADATAKYGRPAQQCRYAHVPLPKLNEILRIKESDFPGGIAFWGAVPPVYDTTLQPLDRGIHVHARRLLGVEKDIDQTYRKVVFQGSDESVDEIHLSELDAIYFMVSSVFGFEVRYVECSRCRHPHLDRDWFSVHEHAKHLCSACGRTFRDDRAAVGNPLAVYATDPKHRPRIIPASRKMSLCQSEFPGGIQIWGSNPSILRTGPKDEESGIHLHAFDCVNEKPVIDDTFDEVTIDGIVLNPDLLRILMAQSTLPHLTGRIATASCEICKRPHLDFGDAQFTPSIGRQCAFCAGRVSAPVRVRKIISNPMVAVLKELESFAPSKRVFHDLGLISETL